MENTATVQSNLANLIAQKIEQEGEEITISQISRDTKLAMNTVKRYLRGGQGFFDGHAVATLCKYLGCEIGDLLKIVDGGESADSNMTAED